MRYTDCNLFPGRGVTNRTGQGLGYLERTVFSCDYNGWADVPEEEREGLDSFEAARVLPPRALLLPAPVIRAPIALIPAITHRRAA